MNEVETTMSIEQEDGFLVDRFVRMEPGNGGECS
jgi:hypothetical protein